ncbi:unnamed protein product [Timema podura]|uniref:nitric-oxide synthase (NADPH) n=1 Tax=Timema podura TaxID=61482 RepID=A0ABN7NNS1_TIMPD|nr:unnamed protein product [Timema podura]
MCLLCQTVAVGMGMDTSTSVNLWKDKALVEVNIAVIHSFQHAIVWSRDIFADIFPRDSFVAPMSSRRHLVRRNTLKREPATCRTYRACISCPQKQGVTIVDHHTASSNFMKHMENEQRLRGGCPADWVWIVPPMSGSITPVFHQEMAMYHLKPSFDYQESAWKSHPWKEHAQSGKISVKCKKFHFKQIARAVCLTIRFYRAALLRRIKATVLYATETGKSETYAKRLTEIFNHSFNATVYCMDEFDIEQLPHESLLLIVASTFGNGDAPENGEI